MTIQEILEELKSYSNESIKKVLLKHGAKEPFYGVKIEDLKKIQKKIRKDYKIALELYNTGISDAMYLAGLIADDKDVLLSFIAIKEMVAGIERIADHAANIAEASFYSSEGKDIRHKRDSK